MTWITDCQKHAERAALARRRIAAAAAVGEPAEADAAPILDGLRALLWLDSGIRRVSSTTLIDALIAEYGVAAVLHAAIEVCRTRPLGGAAWMRHACRQRSAQLNRPIIKGEKP